MDKLVAAITTASELLEKYKYYGQADYLNKVIDAVSQPDPGADALQLLTSREMWGGAGAVWDCVLAGLASAREDEREFRKSVIAIAEEMKNRGIQSTRAEQIAEIFRSWNEKNL